LTLRGVETPVDRDTLEKLQNPINHLLRNAVDHGIEMPDERVRQGKPAEGQIIIRASHHAGMLSLQIEDDGAGIDLARLRQRAVERGMMSAAQAAAASTEALLDLLFLPGFSTRQEVSQVSGRGVGLDVVREMVREVGGIVRVSSVLGRATTFHLMLPMTRAVVRALLVLIAGEPYAFPLARLDRVMRLPKAAIQMTEGRQFFLLQGEPVGISWAGHAFSVPGQVWREEDECALVILGEQRRRHALIVDRYIGERSLVVRPLDPRLGAIPGIQAAAILDDGVPILLVDVDGVLDWLQQLPGLHTSAAPALGAEAMARVRYKRVLLAEDTLVLREFLRHIMATQGYEVHAVPDGVQAWQALQQAPYDLLVTDIEMPEMDGFSLLQRVRQTGGLRRLPVIICSSHAEEAYRFKGLELGADAYVVKQGLKATELAQAVEDLIGQA
jgi:two-component system sensor histidine kinase and response regulator WspE